MASPDKAELRQLLDRDVLEAIDMIALAKHMQRHELIARVLTAYVAERQRQAALIVKAPTVNGVPFTLKIDE